MRKNEFGRRFINIGLEKSAVAAASVVEGPSRCSNKEGKSVEVYKTPVRIICFNGAEARTGNGPSTAFNAPESYRASSVWGKIYQFLKYCC